MFSFASKLVFSSVFNVFSFVFKWVYFLPVELTLWFSCVSVTFMNIDFNDEKFRNVRKMPALFVIDRVNHVTLREINPNAEWLFDEPARATAKRDGTSVTVDENGNVFARRMVRKGKVAPEGFMLAETDPITGNMFGLEPVEQSGFFKMFKEARENFEGDLPASTFELVGPKINGNPEGVNTHTLMIHGSDNLEIIPDVRTIAKEDAFDTFKEIFAVLRDRGVEGVVWWGENGKRVKLRTKDFFGDSNRK